MSSTRPLHLALDARLLSRQTSGLERYLSELLRHLAGPLQPQERVTVFLGEPTELAAIAGDDPRIQAVAAQDARDVCRWLLQHPVDVYHLPWLDRSAPHYAPLLAAPRAVLTVPDFILYDHADYFGGGSARRRHGRFRRNLMAYARCAQGILVYSDYLAGEVRRRLAIPPERIRAVHLAATSLCVRKGTHPSSIPATEPPPDLPRRYVLSIGKDYPHKNLVRLAEAVIQLRSAGVEKDVALVLVGQSVWPQTRRQLEDLGARNPGLLHLLPPSDDATLSVLLRHAAVFAFPSQEEGFGLPPLEALAAGLPVVASRAGPMPEILGEAALYVDPSDTAGLARALAEALRPERAAEFRRLGPPRAAAFSWSSTAARTLDFYREVAALPLPTRMARWRRTVLATLRRARLLP